MAKYIELDKAIKLIADDKVEITPLLLAIGGMYTAEQAFDGINQACDRHIKLITELPTVDVRPVVHGKWTLNKDGSGTCSECGYIQPGCWDVDNWDNFCHHCGADMREVING